MANGAALIRESLWRDRDFRALPRTAQCLYLQLLSQKDLDCAGVLTLHVDLLSKGCDEMTVDNLWHDLKALAETRFITVDSDSDEVLIRSYVRLVSVKSPKVWIAAKSAAKRVFSPEIRQVLACELRRLGRADANDLANELQPDGYPTDTPSIPYRSGIDTQYPIDTVSIPTVPVTVPVLKSPTVGGWVGEDPPPTTCLKHPHGTNEPCGACQTARKANEAWETRRAAQIADERRTRRAAIDACPHCEPTGLRETPAGMTRCTHDPDTFDDEPF